MLATLAPSKTASVAIAGARVAAWALRARHRALPVIVSSPRTHVVRCCVWRVECFPPQMERVLSLPWHVSVLLFKPVQIALAVVVSAKRV